MILRDFDHTQANKAYLTVTKAAREDGWHVRSNAVSAACVHLRRRRQLVSPAELCFRLKKKKETAAGALGYVGKIQLYQNWYYTALVLYASIIRDTGALVSVLSRKKSNMQSCFVSRRFLVALEATFHRTSTSQMNPRSKQCLIPFHLRFARPLTVAHLRFPLAMP